jgi:hypothetical protein
MKGCVHDLGSSENTLKAIMGEANPGFYCTVCAARWVAKPEDRDHHPWPSQFDRGAE